jgi:FkbM family methyltransferase
MSGAYRRAMTAIFPYERENPLKEAFFAHARDGFFVEVGANDPEKWSQTFHLEQLGWRGIVVEPQPDLAAALHARPRAIVCAVACSAPENAGRSMTLHLAGIHSSLDPQLKVAAVRPAGTVEVPLTTLDRLLEENGAPTPLDFLAIDVEGHEIDVLRGFDFARWRPRLMLVEDLVLDLSLHRFMVAHGYKWVRRTDINSWYVPAASGMQVSPLGRWQFFRKYYLGTPFRRMREALRRLRARFR